MKIHHVPSLGGKYWTALVLASLFGCNTGDFFADQLGLGHLAGLPVLAVLFTIAIIAERFDTIKHYAYFWFVIIVIRTAATNIGDISHDLRLNAPLVIAALTILLFMVILCWKTFYSMRNRNVPSQHSGIFSTSSFYWVPMLLAGTLGTVVGDYFSFGLKFGTLQASLILGSILAATFALCKNGLKKETPNIFCYWLVVVLIRSAGTAAGDWIAHILHLPPSTLLTGLIFVAFLIFWNEKKEPVSNRIHIVTCAE